MPKRYSVLLAAALCCGSFAALCCALLAAGCVSTRQVDPATGQTNVIKAVDPVRLKQIREIIEPGAASVLRRAIRRSPEHAQEITDYARAVASIFCEMQASGNFSVDSLVAAADRATARLQAEAVGEGDWVEDVIDGKALLIGVYKAAAGDDLTWQLPDNAWLREVTALICGSITQALTDAATQPAGH